MIITSKKTTKVNTTISWRKSLKTDLGTTFATMTATIDERRPLGTVTFSVIDQNAYNENIESARYEYEQFQKEVIESARTIIPTVENVEEI